MCFHHLLNVKMFFKIKCEITVDNPDKEKIIIGYCRAQETFIIFIRLHGYKDQYKRLLARKLKLKFKRN